MVKIIIMAWAGLLPLYLDPGSGSILIQLILAGALGVGVIVRIFWSNIKNLFTRKQDKSGKPGDHSENE